MAPSCRFVPLGPMGLLTKKGQNSGREVMSGRATAIAIHPTDPNTVYVGTAGGGVWKTTDAGAHWRALTDRQWTLSIGALAIDPSNPDRIYAGTGEANITGMSFVSEGLLISDDGGGTWRRSSPLSASRDLTMMAKIVVSAAGDRVFIGTDAGLFLLRPQQPPATQVTVIDPDPISDLAFDDAQNRLFIAKRRQGLALWTGAGAPVQLGRSGAPATRFPDLPSMLGSFDDVRLALAWIPSEPNTLFVVIALDVAFADPQQKFVHSVLRSDDAGNTWTAVAGPLPSGAKRTGIFAEAQAVYNLLFGRDPNAPSNLYLGLKNLFRSTSLGADWSPSVTPSPVPVKVKKGSEDSVLTSDDLHADQHTIAFAASGEVWVGNDGGIWQSSTAGRTWHHRNRGLATMQFYNGGVDANLAGLIMGGTQDNGFQRFEGHPVWRYGGEGDVGMVALDATGGRFWVATNDGQIHLDDGPIGRVRNVPFPHGYSQGNFLAPFAIAPSDPTIVYTGSKGDLFKADVDTTTWIRIQGYAAQSNGNVSAIAVAPGNPRLVYVAAADASVARLELGFPATDLQFPDDPDFVSARVISDMAVSPRDSNRLYVVLGEVRRGVRPSRRRIYRCDAGTGTWQDLTDKLPWFQLGTERRAPSVNPIYAIVIDPDPAVTVASLEHVYVGCERGVFRSWNGGDSWELIDDGLPLTPVYDLMFQQSTRRLIAFTHGRGVWMRPADIDPCVGPPTVKEVDLYLRDQRYDIALGPTPPQLVDPLASGGAPSSDEDDSGEDDSEEETEEDADANEPPPPIPVILRSTDGVDLKVDRQSLASELAAEDKPDAEPAFQAPASTVDYLPDGPLDAIGFEALEHRPPNPKAPARVYVQVHNRGPDEATNVVVRVYWAAQAAEGSYPDLPADFWSQYPATDPAADSPWQPIGPASILAQVRPAEPEVVLWTWNVPAKLPAKIGLLAIVTSPDDPVDEGQPLDALERKVDPLVRNNKRVLLKTTETVQAAVSSGRSWGWLKWVGLAAGVGIGATVLYEELK